MMLMQLFARVPAEAWRDGRQDEVMCAAGGDQSTTSMAAAWGAVARRMVSACT